MKRIGLYGSIVVIILAGLTTYLLMPAPARPPATLTPAQGEITVEAALYPTDTPQPTHTPVPPTPVFYDEYTIVILGQDETVERCWIGERCGETSHSDVFVIVHVTMSPIPKAVAVLVPRNLYVLPEMMLLSTPPETWDPLWSMQVYGKHGMGGVHQYVNAVFGLPVQAVFITKMDRFIEIVNALGGLDIHGKTMGGDKVLSFLRDNDNNWGCPTYDCNGRIFVVAEAFRAKTVSLAGLTAIASVLSELKPLYETDLGDDQLLWLLTKYTEFELRGGTVTFVRLWTPIIVRTNTPLNTRGMVPTYPLYDWMTAILKFYE